MTPPSSSPQYDNKNALVRSIQAEIQRIQNKIYHFEAQQEYSLGECASSLPLPVSPEHEDWKNTLIIRQNQLTAVMEDPRPWPLVFYADPPTPIYHICITEHGKDDAVLNYYDKEFAIDTSPPPILLCPCHFLGI